MKPETEEWIRKAEGNWNAVNQELKRSKPVKEVVCLLAHLCAEQYIKSFLEENEIAFPITHDLLVLLDCAGDQLSELDSWRHDLAYLGTVGIAARYRRTGVEEISTRDAMRIVEEVRSVIRTKLRLS